MEGSTDVRDLSIVCVIYNVFTPHIISRMFGPAKISGSSDTDESMSCFTRLINE